MFLVPVPSLSSINALQMILELDSIDVISSGGMSSNMFGGTSDDTSGCTGVLVDKRQQVGVMSGGTGGFGRFSSHPIVTSVNDGIARLKLQGSAPVLH